MSKRQARKRTNVWRWRVLHLTLVLAEVGEIEKQMLNSKFKKR